jgi:hypothetical protein
MPLAHSLIIHAQYLCSRKANRMDHQDQSSPGPDQMQGDVTATGVRMETSTPNLLWGILIQPVKTLTYLRDQSQRTWLAPVILAVLLVIAQSLVTVPVANQAATAQMEEQLAQMQIEEAAQIEGRMDRGARLPLLAGTMLVSGLIGLWMRWLFRSGAIHLFSLGLGGRNRFSQIFSMVVWTWVPLLMRSLLQTLSIAFSGTLPTHQGLAAYLAALGQPLPAGTPYALLSQTQLDLFALWNLMLLALGVLIITELSRAKALLVAAGYWALATGLSLVPTLVQQFFLSRFPMVGGSGG